MGLPVHVDFISDALWFLQLTYFGSRFDQITRKVRNFCFYFDCRLRVAVDYVAGVVIVGMNYTFGLINRF